MEELTEEIKNIVVAAITLTENIGCYKCNENCPSGVVPLDEKLANVLIEAVDIYKDKQKK